MAAHPQQFSDFTTPLPLKRGDTLVIGIVGAWQHWDTEHNLVRRITNHLRASQLPGLYVESVENHRMELARELLLRALDTNEDKKLDAEEKREARIIIYGHSLGGSAAVGLCRWLQENEVPVLLNIQIDSVGRRDGKIPPNVREAANLYQRDFGPIRGLGKIVAQDPQRTKILGNWRFHYGPLRVVPAIDAPLADNLLQIPHRKMEFDPEVWLKVEGLILSRLLQ